MSDRGFIDFNYGPLTWDAINLFGEGAEYRRGYFAGLEQQSTRGRDIRLGYMIKLRGAECLAGYRKGVNERHRREAEAVEDILRKRDKHGVPPPVPVYIPRTSYRDPDLSDQWLREAEDKARHLLSRSDARKIILRLIQEVQKLNRLLGR
ncbi:hypothetical protein ACTXJR_05745 [Glutamicibacter ardleyensis]|uniref:hypothetical protein n=1 Tax=Glutamicibacter ardleyensis TaxID=225894 RepID=UPI003FD6BE41